MSRFIVNAIILVAAGAFYLGPSGVLPAAAPDPFRGAVEVRHYSFEEDEDRDYDDRPDDWTRRRDAGFPAYVKWAIDRERGADGEQSLRFDLNGGEAIAYSPPIRIDARHSYVFRGKIRTQLLEHGAALLSVSLLNYKRQRVGRYLTRPVTGTHQDWVQVRLGPILADKDVSFLVVGCHLVEGEDQDIRGAVWFDDLWVGKLPRLTLASNFHRHFIEPLAPIRIESDVSGLDPSRNYRLNLEMTDSAGNVVDETSRPLRPETAPDGSPADAKGSFGKRVTWSLPSQDFGFYRVHAALQRNGQVILDERTTFAVMDLIEEPRGGEFGWTIDSQSHAIGAQELADVAFQAGINWLKYPLWQSASADEGRPSGEVSAFLDRLVHRGITPVGLLNNPPSEIRQELPDDWSGAGEIFRLPPSFWWPRLEPVVARYSASVRYWQLGDDSDKSFVGSDKIDETLASVKKKFDETGRRTRIGVPWNWRAPLPSGKKLSHSFFSISNVQPEKDDELQQHLRNAAGPNARRWVLLKPLPRTGFTVEERGKDLVKRMVAAKRGGADAVFAWDVFDPQYGLLNEDGSPRVLFLPWRTTARALRGADFLGSLNLPGGSRNFVFVRDGEAILILWNEERTTEQLYLGERVRVTDIWGRQRPVSTVQNSGKQQRIEVGPVPVILRGCSEAIVRWRLAIRFEKGRQPSRTGRLKEAILGRNTFPQGVRGQVRLNVPQAWQVEPRVAQIQMGAGEEFRVPVYLQLPSSATFGKRDASVEFDIIAERPYHFRVHRPYRIGLQDLTLKVVDRKLPDGRLQIEQIVTNRTSPAEVLDLNCLLYIPHRRRQKRIVTRLNHGQDRKIYYLSDAEELRGEELWLRVEEKDGSRVLNYRWTVGEDWDKSAETGK